MKLDMHLCCCQCHNHYRGTQKAAQQMGKYMKGFTFAERANQWDKFGVAFEDDALAAAVACDECRAKHCEALLTPHPFKRAPRIVRRFDPNSDSQQTNSDTQADGDSTDKGEGAE